MPDRFCRTLLRIAAACLLGFSASGPVAVRAAPAPVLDIGFATMPHWRGGAIPAQATPVPFADRSFALRAGLASGLRPPYKWAAALSPAWASLGHEQEAYPDADAMTDLGLSPFSIQDGALHLTASPMPAHAAETLPANMKRAYMSGAFNTYPFGQTYGYFEVTAKVPKGRGLWPAFWLLPVDQSWPPEIDLAEVLGRDTTIAYQSIHTTDKAWVASQPGSYNGSTTTQNSHTAEDLSAGFHRYAVDWTPTRITFYLDDVVTAERPTPADMHKPFYLIINLAVGDSGSWPGPPTARTRFPASLAIRSIRIWSAGAHAI